jgi:hypothetical protein
MAKNRPEGVVVTDDKRRLKFAQQRGFNMFELQLKKSQSFDQKIFGYDDLVVRKIDRVNSSEVQMQVIIEKGSDILFTPNDENVLIAYLPDTPKNRRLLALTIYTASFFINCLILKSNVEVPGEQIRKEILDYARQIGVKIPTPADRNPRRNVPVVAPRFKTVAEVETAILAKHASLIEALKEEHGDKFQKSAIYISVVQKDIDTLCRNVGLLDAGTAVEDTGDSAPVIARPSKAGRVRLPVEKAPAIDRTSKVKEPEGLVT